MKKIFKLALLAVFPVALLLLVGEGVARLWPGDFAIQRPMFVASGHEEYFGTRRVFLPYQAFPPYYWWPVPNTELTNARGFRGHPIADHKQPGTTRIVCLGCSCTLGGQEPYPQRLERLLAESIGPGRYEVINASAGSSSTCQGLQILENRVLPLRPDIVVVFFGWNDRWVHDGRRDSRHRLPSAAEQRLVQLLSHSRLIRGLMYLADRYRSRTIEQRVPPTEYAANLRRIIQLVRGQGAKVVLCTTPDGVTQRAIEFHLLESNNSVNRTRELYALYRDQADTPVGVWNHIQQLYNQTVETVAREERVELIDLDRQIRERKQSYPETELRFFKDGIHFTELGLQEVARTLALHLVPQTERPRLEQYLASPVYFERNAERFVAQYQYGAAAALLDRAAQSGAPDRPDLRDQIAANRAWWDQYDAANFALYNGGDPQWAFQQWLDCLRQRPGDTGLRLDLARLALQFGAPQTTLQLYFEPTANFDTGDAQHQALWLTVQAAAALGQRDLMRRQLELIIEQFPEDDQARQVWREQFP